MADLGPMEACPFSKRGMHNFMVVVPNEDKGDLTLCCELCGSMRRVTAVGELPTKGLPLDARSAVEIQRAFERRS